MEDEQPTTQEGVEEPNAGLPSGPPKAKRCRMCRTVVEVDTYVDKTGKIKVNLCATHKEIYGDDLKLWVPPADFKAIKAKSEEHRKKIDAALVVPTCDYPACRATKGAIRLYVTRTPNPKNGQSKGHYCSFHANLLNSAHKFLPYAYGKCTEFLIEAIICHKELELKEVARQFEVPPDSLIKLTSTLLELINPHDAALFGYAVRFPRKEAARG